MHKHLVTAFEIARTNVYHKSIDYHLAAVIVTGGSIISQGCNNMKSNGFVEHYADRVLGKRDFCISTHAEATAINSARRKTDLTGSKIFVARRSKETGQPTMARPCAVCEDMIQSYGIKRAYYTIDAHHYGIMKISGLKTKDKIIRI